MGYPKKFFYIADKKSLRVELGFDEKDYLIGSFQRDTESKDLKSPKLIKGPDIFLQILIENFKMNRNLKVVLAGKNRQFIISQLEKYKIPFKYFEMVNVDKLNKLYNILDLYLVTSRIEGGPQAILEASVSKTPILSTNVGVASEILHHDSIFKPESFITSKVNIDYAYKKSQEFTIPEGINKFDSIISDIYES